MTFFEKENVKEGKVTNSDQEKMRQERNIRKGRFLPKTCGRPYELPKREQNELQHIKFQGLIEIFDKKLASLFWY